MSTKNIIPRNSGEGEIGLGQRPWSKAHFDEGSFTNSLIVGGQNISDKINEISGALADLEETPDINALSGSLDSLALDIQSISGALVHLEETPDVNTLSGSLDSLSSEVQAISGFLANLEESQDINALSGQVQTISGALASLEETPDINTLSGLISQTGSALRSDIQMLSGAVVSAGTPNANSVVSSSIVNGAVTTDKIASDSINSSHLSVNSVTVDSMSDNSVGSSELIDESVTFEKLDPSLVFEDISGTGIGSRITNSGVPYLISGDVQSITAGSIGTESLADSSITSQKIADSSITATKIVDGSITSSKILDGSVAGSKLSDASIVSGKIAAGSIGSSHILDQSISTVDLANKSVTSEKLEDSITVAQNLSVGGDFFVSGSTVTIEASTIVVEDKNIELGVSNSASNATADGGGITLKGDVGYDKTFTWSNESDSWESNQHIQVPSGIDGDVGFLKTNRVIAHDGDDLSIFSSSEKGITIKHGGNVGIGTASPAYTLDVTGDINFNGSLTQNGTLFSGGGSLENWTETNGNIIPNSNEAYDLGNAEYKVRHLFLSDNSLHIGETTISVGDTLGELIVPSGLAVTKNSTFNGSVGIGTASPNTLLEVAASSNVVTGGEDPVAIRIGHTNQDGGSNTYNLVDDVCQLQFYSADASHSSATGGVRASIGMISEGVAGGSMALTFGTHGAEKMRINSAGNVGIGTTNPNRKLQVHSDTATSQTIGVTTLEGSTVVNHASIGHGANRIGNLQLANAAGNLKVKLVAGGDSYFDGGSLGIGTTSPSSLLDVAGSFRVKVGDGTISSGCLLSGTIDIVNGNNSIFGSSTFFSKELVVGDQVYINLNTYTVDSITSDGEMSVTPPISTVTATSVGFYRLSERDMVFADKLTGNVGIGTASPAAKLDVQTDSFGDIVKLGTVDGTNNPRMFIGSSATGMYLKQSHTTGAGSFDFQNAAGGSRMYIAENGNVGIGTTSPGAYILSTHGSSPEFVQEIRNTNASNAYGLYISSEVNHDNATSEFIRCSSGPIINFRVFNNGQVEADGVQIASDDRIKHNEKKIENAVEALSKINPKKYFKTSQLYDAGHNFDLDSDGNPVDENGEAVKYRVEAGVIAQEVLGVDELKFTVSPERKDEEGNVVTPYSLNYSSLFTYAIAAIQEQQSIIEGLRGEAIDQSSVVNDLVSRIEALENK